MIEKVLVSVECADCHREYDSQQQPERMVATKDEINRAIELLRGSSQWQNLKNFAAWRVRGLGRASCGRTGEDLFHDALLSTFIVRRIRERAGAGIRVVSISSGI